MTSTSEPAETSGTAPDPGQTQPLAPDEVLLASRDLARAALAEITDPRSIGADAGYEIHEAHVLTLYFECRLEGYPGWRWAATLARADELTEPTVLEVELLPGEGAVIAPEWVPWSERLAQYRETQARQAAEGAAAETAEDLAEDDASDSEDDLPEDEDDEGIDDDRTGPGDEDDDLDDEDSDLDDEDDEEEVDEDGFADLDEHDLHDHGDDDDLLDEEEE